MSGPWRDLGTSAPASGWWNMALDEVLLASAARDGIATLRLYRWRGPWLSLGYAQPFDAAAAGACRAAGVTVVRRATGGRAVLHGADLTYAVAAPESLLPPGLEGAYRLLSDALLDALRAIGVAAEPAPRAASESPVDGFDCFAAAATDEICVAGRKVAGSAQRRAAGAVLQHGSIRLAPDPVAAARIARLGAGATSLAELGFAAGAGRAAIVQALPRALAARLGRDPLPRGVLRDEERRAARARAAALRLDPLAKRSLESSRAS
jgi:lipoate-protein ligase A